MKITLGNWPCGRIEPTPPVSLPGQEITAAGEGPLVLYTLWSLINP